MKNVTKCHLSQFYPWNKNQKSKRLNRSEYRGRIQQSHLLPAREVLQKIQGNYWTLNDPISTQNDRNWLKMTKFFWPKFWPRRIQFDPKWPISTKITNFDPKWFHFDPNWPDFQIDPIFQIDHFSIKNNPILSSDDDSIHKMSVSQRLKRFEKLKT